MITLRMPGLIKWLLGLDTSEGSQCSLCLGSALDHLGHHAFTCKHGEEVVTRHTSPLNPQNLLKAGVTATAATLATEARKYQENNPKCSELG